MNAIVSFASLATLLVLGGCFAFHPRRPPFQSVRIDSFPKGWGSAFKEVDKSGAITGGHASGAEGSPPLMFMDKSIISRADMSRLSSLVAAVVKNPPKSAGSPPDQKKEGYVSVSIYFDNNQSIAVYKTWEQKEFPFPNVQAIWDLIYKYKAGAW